jgi:hypothetical protein
MVEVGTGTHKSKYVRRVYPITEGITAGTTKQHGRSGRLKATKGSFIPKRKKVGL